MICVWNGGKEMLFQIKMGQKRDLELDVQDNERNKPESKRLKVDVKDCSRCGECKSLDQYSVNRIKADGLRGYCKACANDLDKTYRSTQDGFLNALVGSARRRTKQRKKKGRNHEFTLTLAKLKNLIMIQNGKCSISGAVLVFKPYSDNQASVDRIDNNIGYVDGNCRLVCLEFNTSVKWSRKILLDAIAISGIPPENFGNEISDLETVQKRNFNNTVYKRWKVLESDGIRTVFCHYCSKTKLRENFNKSISEGCKSCRAQFRQRNYSTWRGALQRLIDNAKSHTELRNKRRKEDDQTKCTLTYLQLVSILKAQGGMCAYSRVAMSPRMGDWKVSLERKDINEGYAASNVCLVCQRFNAIDNTAQAEGPVEGSGGWSREKFLRFAALVTV
jgi:hypothetical protein